MILSGIRCRSMLERLITRFFAIVTLAAAGLALSPTGRAQCTGAGQSSQTLYVATVNKVFVYTLGAANPRLIITGGVASPNQIATDTAGNRYVSNFGTPPLYSDSSVTEYGRGHTSPTLTRTDGAFSASGVAVNALADVFASSYYRNTVSVYHTGQVTPFLVFNKSIVSPYGLAVTSASLYVGEPGYGKILQFPSNSTTTSGVTLTLKSPDTPPQGSQTFGGSFVVGGDGTVYAGGAITASGLGYEDFLNVFAPGATSPRASVAAFKGTAAQSAPSVAVAGDDLYAAVYDNNSVVQYEVGQTLTVVRTITAGLTSPGPIALDAGSCLYVANLDGRVTVYPPGATTPSQTIVIPGGGPLYALIIGH